MCIFSTTNIYGLSQVLIYGVIFFTYSIIDKEEISEILLSFYTVIRAGNIITLTACVKMVQLTRQNKLIEALKSTAPQHWLFEMMMWVSSSDKCAVKAKRTMKRNHHNSKLST